jgi:curved DNA-binding protein CbpA
MTYLMDYYRILQVHHEASPEVIEAAYRRLSKMNHPDVSENPAAMERMKSINAAYEVLGCLERRQQYQEEWIRLVGAVGPIHKKQAAETGYPVDPCYRLLDDYFQDLLQGRWERAYQRLTRADQMRISRSEFVCWKQEVAKVYQLGSYALKLFRKHYDCQLADALYREVREYSVYVCDMQLMTGRMNEETMSKYVAFEHDEWRICLGYESLKPYIMKFKYLADQAQHVNPDRALSEALLRMDGMTDLLSRSGLLSEMEREAQRSNRYRNPFSVAVINVLPAKNIRGFHRDEYQNICMKHAADKMREVFRRTDLAGRWTENGFAVLMTETDEPGAKQALLKFENLINQICEPAYEICTGYSGYIHDSLEDTIRMAESNAMLRQTGAGVQKQTTIILTGSSV